MAGGGMAKMMAGGGVGKAKMMAAGGMHRMPDGTMMKDSAMKGGGMAKMMAGGGMSKMMKSGGKV